MNNRFARFLQLALPGLDIVIINLVVIISKLTLQKHISPVDYIKLDWFWIYLNLSWIMISLIVNIYSQRYIMSFELFSRYTFRAFLLWLGLVFLYLFVFKLLDLSRAFVILTVAGTGAGLLINRIAYLLVRYYFRDKDYLTKKVIIIGYNEPAKKLASYLEEESLKTEIVGFCEEPDNVHELSNYPILSSIKDTMTVSRQYEINEIYSTIAPEQKKEIYSFMEEAEQACIRFHVIPDMSRYINRPVHIDYLKDMPVLSLHNEPLNDVSNRFKKRLFDIFTSATIIIFILSWVIPVIALLVWIGSRFKGPVFFFQKRSGRDNRLFSLVKFRTMVADSTDVDDEGRYKQATRNDPRITKLGNFLRKTSLDELPQFWNVLMGDMSIVGPRPHPVPLNQASIGKVDEYMIRYFVKPGITGWAQVRGFRGETKSFTQMRLRVEHDIWYLENWSLWLDVRIMVLTVLSVIKGDKNAF
jgi:putative colanic acid biosysnthesis UDP-glucose lipid carrier transferase